MWMCKKIMYGSEFPLMSFARWDGDALSSTDDDLRDAMAWRGVAWHAMAFIITILDSRSPKTNATSPHLISFTPRLYHYYGISLGIPHSLSSTPSLIR
jgi:hypothetical protein